MFKLEGWDQEFSSIKELTNSLKTFVLKSGEDSFTLKKCCLPRLGGACVCVFVYFQLGRIYSQTAESSWSESLIRKNSTEVHDSYHLSHPVNRFYGSFAELSNLLVMRKGANSSIKTVSETLNLSQLRFHQIKDKEITKVCGCTQSVTFLSS